jgi:glucokinase
VAYRDDGDLKYCPLENLVSGWGIESQARTRMQRSDLPITAQAIAARAAGGDPVAGEVLDGAWSYLAEGICHVLALLGPRRIVIGGGVALMGEELLFQPLRRHVAQRVFRPFVNAYDIVPAALGEEVTVHGAVALARKRLGA